MEADHNSIHGRLAVSFASHLVAGQYREAHAILTSYLQEEWTIAELEHEYSEMTDYGNGPADRTQLMATLETWPGREANDVGWAYVSISGNGFVEGVAVVVSQDSGAPLVRQIEWGRP